MFSFCSLLPFLFYPAGLALCEALITSMQTTIASLSGIRERFPLEMKNPVDHGQELGCQIAEVLSMAEGLAMAMRLRSLALHNEINQIDARDSQHVVQARGVYKEKA